jgi:hypothetical protein
MAGDKGVNRSWSVPSRVRVRGCRSLSCPTVSGALIAEDYEHKNVSGVTCAWRFVWDRQDGELVAASVSQSLDGEMVWYGAKPGSNE